MFELLKNEKYKMLLNSYIKNGSIFYLIGSILLNGGNKNSLELARIGIQNRLKKKLAYKYRKTINTELVPFKNNIIIEETSPIWVCWFQGIEDSPKIVQKCYESIKKYGKRPIILITDENYKKYTNLPEYIIKKYEQKQISKTHFSDILRIDLLARHGGTWIDATVLLTDFLPDEFTQSDLFFFQKCKPGKDGNGVFISSWYLSAKPNHPIIILTRSLLLEYWRKNNTLIDYFLFHIFFCISCEKYHEEYLNVAKMDNSAPHYLQLEFNQTVNQNRIKQIKKCTGINKLTYKVSDEIKYDKKNIYNYVIENDI